MGTTGAAESAVFFFSPFICVLVTSLPANKSRFGELRPTFHLFCHQGVIFQPVFADRQHFTEPLKGSEHVYRRLQQPRPRPGWLGYFYMFQVQWKCKNRLYLFISIKSAWASSPGVRPVVPSSPGRMQSAGLPKFAVPSTNRISIFSALYFELSALAR